MSLEDLKKQSEKQKQEESLWISTRLGDEGSILIDEYVGEELVDSQYRDNDNKPLKQLEMTFLALGQEMKLARSFPLSKESERFVDELLKVKNQKKFIIEKKLDSKGNPLFYAKTTAESVQDGNDNPPTPTQE